MQTITQSVVESHTKLVYKYIKQDVEAENNHIAKGRVEQMGTPTEIYKNPKTPFVAQFIGESAVIADYDRLKGFHLYPGCSRAIIRPEFVKAVRYGTEKRYQSLYAEGIVEQKSRGIVYRLYAVDEKEAHLIQNEGFQENEMFYI